MDRRTLIAIVLFVGLWWAYFFVRPMLFPPEVPPAETDAVAQVDAAGDGSADAAAAQQDGTDPDEPRTEPAPAPPPPSPAVQVPRETVPFQACEAAGTLTWDGGHLRGVELEEYEGPYEVTALYSYLFGLVTGGDTNWQPYGGDPGRQRLGTESARFFGMGSGGFDADAADVVIEKQADGSFVLRGTTRDGIEVTRTLSVNDVDTCVVQIEASWHNPTETDFEGRVWLQLHDDLPPLKSAYDHAFKPYWSLDDGSWNSYTYPQEGGWMGLYEPLDQATRYDGTVDWFGLSDGYFSVVAVPDGRNSGRLVLSPIETGEQIERDGETVDQVLYGHHYVIDGLAAGATVNESFTVYMGPNDTATLGTIHDTLYYLVDLGWFAFFGRPLLWLLELYHSFIGNWGLSIILLTFTIKLAFFPLTQMAYVSSQRMAALQPQLKVIREKYADNQEELNKQTMALFRENKVNPIGGCLPMLLQAPIWISLYRVLLTSVDLYHTEFLYLKDLSVADPYCILPLIVVGLMFLQQQLMPTSASMDPNQQRIMKFMPIFIGFLFFTFPSGLVLYIFVNTSLTIVQQWFIKRRYGSGGSNGPPASPAPAAAK